MLDSIQVDETRLAIPIFLWSELNNFFKLLLDFLRLSKIQGDRVFLEGRDRVSNKPQARFPKQNGATTAQILSQEKNICRFIKSK